jgi:hypothetical protein
MNQSALGLYPGSHPVVVIKKGKLYHRQILDEFVMTDTDSFKIIQRQRLIFKGGEKSPLSNILSQANEQRTNPLWHSLEKVLRNHSNLYNQVVAITDISPAT